VRLPDPETGKVLPFIGMKIFVGDWMFDGKVPASISLGVTAGLLAGGILYPLWKTRGGAAALKAV
jgi:tellurite resistance protein TerC